MRGRRPDGRQGKVTLGPLDLSPRDEGEPTLGAPLSLRAARVLANQLLRQRAKGVDIAEAKVELSRKRGGGNTFPAVAEEFIADHARPRNRGWRDTAQVLGLDYPKDGNEPELMAGGLARRWAAKPIGDISAAAIHAVVTESRRSGIPGTKARVDGDPSESAAGRWPPPSASCSAGRPSTGWSRSIPPSGCSGRSLRRPAPGS